MGDDLDGGKVIAIDSSDGCAVVTISHDADWSCSGEQLDAVQNGVASGVAAPPAPASDPSQENIELVATDCEGLADLRRPVLKQAEQQSLDAQRLAILRDKCLPKTEVRYYQHGQQVSYCSNYTGRGYAGGYASAAGGSSFAAPTVEDGAGEGEGAEDYSTTNVQVAGVDEADFVKNDGEHVYVLAADGLHVIDAWPAPETREVAFVQLPGEPRRLFLDGDRLVVYLRTGVVGGGSPSQQGCTYGYDCRFASEGGQTMVVVYDVSVPSEPQELRRYAFSGGFVASRRVGPTVYTVVDDGAAVSPVVAPTLTAASPEQLEDDYERASNETAQAMDDAPASAFLPWARRLDADGSSLEEIDGCDDALAGQAAQGTSFVSLIAFDLETLAQPARTLVAGKPGYVYSSASALYLATDGVDGGDFIYSYGAADDRSTIHKFALDGIRTRYRGSASVPGHVLNQFSMDELDGVLRVATSSGWVPDPSVSSNLVTLSEQDGAFRRLGSIGGIAPTEDIRSVRFDGTRGFVVTFKKTDPLFVFDLSDPAQPSILGELKIPGFSTYMHPMDEDHLLAIGFDADDQGDFAYFDGIQLQIFDVSELSNPLLLHKTTIGTRGSASEALTNHLAFNYFPSKGLLALPMTVCEGGDNGVYGDQLTFSGLMVFDVSLETGIVERGRMPFVDTTSIDQSYDSGWSCGNWWTQSTSDVKRSIFMDDYAVGISDTLYQVAPLADLDEVLHSLPLGSP